jgi:PAS domain S-box-containing protein
MTDKAQTKAFDNGHTESPLEVRSKHKPTIIFLNPFLLFSIVLLLIFLTSAGTMLVTAFFQPLHTLTEALIKAFILSVILLPILYHIVIRPSRLYLTECKKTEYVLKESERRFRETLENLNLIAVQLDKDGTIIFTNNFLLSLTGWTAKEILGKNWMDIFIPEDLRDEIKQLHRDNVLKGKIIIHNVNEIISKEGEKLLISWNNSHMFDLEKKIIGTTSIGEDITDKKEIEEALKESEERFKLMMHQSPSVIELYDLDGLQIEVNKAYEDLWGFPASHTVNKFNVLKSKEVEDTGLMAYVKDAYAGKAVRIPEYKFDSTGETEAKGAGRLRWLSTRIYPLKDRAGNVKNIVITHEDISDIKFAEEERFNLTEQLRHSQKIESIGILAGGIAHDFNNILNAILGYTYLVRLKTPGDSETASNLDRIIESTHRAADLIRQILTFSRQDGEERQPVMVMPIVREALKMLRASIPATIEIRQNIGPTGQVLADSVQIQQVIMNLCTNAYHAMQDMGGVMEIDLQEVNIDTEYALQHIDMNPGPHVRLTVSDTGQGIDPSIIDKIFEPYFTSKEMGKGTGLGLSLVHGIVKHCGGSITVESEVSKGTSFVIYLPVIQQEAKPEAKVDGAIIKGAGTVLFVDDEKSIVLTISEILEILGYKVASSTDSLEALELFRKNPDKFDVVLTDMTMPNMTGIKLSQEILGIRSDVPIILSTGFTEGINEEMVKKYGIRELLMKPFSPEKLSETIQRVLK